VPRNFEQKQANVVRIQTTSRAPAYDDDESDTDESGQVTQDTSSETESEIDEEAEEEDVPEDFDTQLLQGLESMLEEQIADSKSAHNAYQEVENGSNPNGIDQFFESYEDVVRQQSIIDGIITGVFSAREEVFATGDKFEGTLPPEHRKILQQSRKNLAALKQDYNEMINLFGRYAYSRFS